jgi:hypothetical protein
VTLGVATFVVGPPIFDPRQFFGREREVRRLFALWRHQPLQHAAIIGPRRGGKTSLLLYLKAITTTPRAQLRPGQRADWLPDPARFRWAFVDFQDPRMGHREGVLRHVLSALQLPIPLPCDLERFLEVAGDQLRAPAVILLDEIEVALAKYPELDDTFWTGLRSLPTQTGGRLAFVFAARVLPEDVAKDHGLSSPFFNIFGHPFDLSPLTEAEACDLVASSPRPFPPADTRWILEQSQLWPAILQALCHTRLTALEAAETDDAWRADALRRIEPFRHLLARG